MIDAIGRLASWPGEDAVVTWCALTGRLPTPGPTWRRTRRGSRTFYAVQFNLEVLTVDDCRHHGAVGLPASICGRTGV